ncbi:MAG: hypothetical protein IKS69_01725 [Erysipelotrichaceae bacterium]|nr:hypothetical protein [Erysipelotrichaceae bacterium]
MSKFEDTVKEMESQVKELEDNLAGEIDKLDEEGKEKAKALVERTEEAIRTSIEKVRTVIVNVKEDEKLDEFLDKVKAKSMEAVDFTKEKVQELTAKKEEQEQSLDEASHDIMSTFENIKESETIKKTAEILSDINKKINEFFEKPEVKEAISKAKITTVNIAEKGVEGLKRVLNTEEIEQAKKAVEEPAEEPVEEPKE